jgi:hypothetical protein
VSVTIECPQCHKRYTVDEAASGKTAVCKACGARMQIPDLGQAAAPPEPQPEQQPEQEQPAELPKQMRANRAVAGRTCPICEKAIELGQAVRNCELCGQTHHDECWHKNNGCGTRDCGNAPLPELGFAPGGPQAPPGAEPPPGTKPCPHCGEHIPEAAIKCRHCQEYLPGHKPGAPGGPRPTQPTNSGMAIASLVCGILSIPMSLCCGLVAPVAGIAAIVMGVMARRQIDQSGGRLGGEGTALAGIITGIVGTVIGVLSIVVMIIFQIIAASSQ